MQFKQIVHRSSVTSALLVILLLLAPSAVSAGSLAADPAAPFVTNVSTLKDPLYIGITIVFPDGVPASIIGGVLGAAWFQCSTGNNPHTLYCWGHTIGDYPATLYIATVSAGIIPVTVPPPPHVGKKGPPTQATPPPCGGDGC